MISEMQYLTLYYFVVGMTMIDPETGFPSQSQVKQKRMRTSFKHHQLKIMKQYFNLNHNPDAKDLKQLSQKTGLSKRVLQVKYTLSYCRHSYMYAV